jgi:hypothetical protein
VSATIYFGDRLVDLTLPADRVHDLSPVCGLPGLRCLRCQGTEGNRDLGVLTDLTPLKGLWLRKLFLHHVPVKDLTPLEGMPLRQLGLVGLAIDDLTPLQNMSNLYQLNASSEGVRDLQPLSRLPLRNLILVGTAVTDLTPLKETPLRVLDCRGSLKIRDLAPLAPLRLQMLGCEPDLLRDPANAAVLKGIGTLDIINGQPKAEVLP